MNNFYSGTKEYPHHISVGAVLLNDENKVVCHFYEKKIRKYPENFYTLMHESMEMSETLEDTLHRGLQEEYGAKAEIQDFIGTLIVSYKVDDVDIEKTVLYFLCSLVSMGDRNSEDDENQSEIKWMDIDELIDIMEIQGGKYGESADESKILKDVKKFI